MGVTKRVDDLLKTHYMVRSKLTLSSTLASFNCLAKLTFPIFPTYLKRRAVTFDFDTISLNSWQDVTTRLASPYYLYQIIEALGQAEQINLKHINRLLISAQYLNL